ncbi:small, acid-soluble spore protein K [Evansella clarkii]|uniref:small, acid-soluble spore protein K n=1 Tax=Evansella clarkii TaxID=79879 RepID=UPI000997A559|nr:small, acid-soluble spore protein K [Evansella clarkii]
MRNKAKGFPNRMSLDGEPRAKPAYASKRADGTINTRPAERMQASTEQRDNHDERADQ